MNIIQYKPIGIIYSPFKAIKGTPIQPDVDKDAEGEIEIYPEYADGLKDLDGFSHIILLFHCHLSNKFSLQVKPYMDDISHGVFSTRAPCRPNSIGLSIVRLLKIEKNKLYIKELDIIDGTPLLDIKPYVRRFDEKENIKIGWLENNINKLSTAKDDGRFMKEE